MARRAHELTKEEVRPLWDALKGQKLEAESSVHEFVGVMQVTATEVIGTAIDLVDEPWRFIVTKNDDQAVGFWREIWPEFAAALRTELESDMLAA